MHSHPGYTRREGDRTKLSKPQQAFNALPALTDQPGHQGHVKHSLALGMRHSTADNVLGKGRVIRVAA